MAKYYTCDKCGVSMEQLHYEVMIKDYKYLGGLISMENKMPLDKADEVHYHFCQKCKYAINSGVQYFLDNTKESSGVNE